MDKADLIASLKIAQDAGCQLVVGVPSLGGSLTVALTLEQACLLTTDKQALFADLMGLTKPEYIEWHESQGPVYCSARTKRGKQCRNTIVGATWLQPDEWTTQRTAGGYCAAHGKNMGKAASALAGERYECKTSGPNGTLLQMDGPEEVRRQILVEKKSEPPPDRVLTVRYIDENSGYKANQSHSEEWRSGDEIAVESLLEQYGPAPARL